MAIDSELIDQRLTVRKKSEDPLGKGGLIKEITVQLVERVLDAELTDHLGYRKYGRRLSACDTTAVSEQCLL